MYLMRCDTCKRTLEIGCPAMLHEEFIKPGMKCTNSLNNGCNGNMKQVITAPHTIINRSAFPGTGNEVQLPTNHGEDVRFRDKSEARDWLGERGLTSKWIENDM